MKTIFLTLSILIAVTLTITSCGDQGAGNTGNKAANNTITNANTAGNAAAAEADVRKVVKDAETAVSKNDVDALAKIYSDNYMLVNIDGTVQTKTERLASMKAGDTKYTAFSYDEIGVRTNPEGTGAIVICRATIKGTNKGKAVDGVFRVTQVYSKMKDGWRMVSGQATPIVAGAETPKTDDKKTADADKDKAPANK